MGTSRTPWDRYRRDASAAVRHVVPGWQRVAFGVSRTSWNSPERSAMKQVMGGDVGGMEIEVVSDVYATDLAWSPRWVRAR